MDARISKTRISKSSNPANEAERDDLIVARAEGCFIYDTQGRKYFDFIAGWCVGNLGWNRPEIVAAICGFEGPSYVFPEYTYGPWAELSERLVQLAGGKLRRTFRATGGSEAVDIALQAAMLHTGRSKFISIEGSYHGNGIGNRAVSGSELREMVGRLTPSSSKIKLPLTADRLEHIETLLRKKDVAGFIMEPVICNLGAVVPEKEFMQGVQKLCRRYGTLYILDEVATGFGRTGKLFGFELFDLAPDILCLAKALTAGHAAMGATLTGEAVAKSMQKLGVYSTYGWHPVSTAAALANLDYWDKHRDGLLANVAAIGEFMRSRLESMAFPQGFEVRGEGLAIGIELSDKKRVERIQARCREKGLIIAAEGSALALFPPLTIDRETASDGLDLLEACL